MAEPALVTAATNPRAALRDARRVVVKIGSTSLARGGPDGRGRFASLAADLAALRSAGKTVVLVSSGAIALGWARLGFAQRPTELAEVQAAAAAGQSALMRAWEDACAPHGFAVAQLLLTHADLADRARYLSARAVLDVLLARGALPVINENDTVASEEIRFGDNDRLAAMVATLAGADLLILLTDVAGLLDASGTRVGVVADLAAARALVSAGSSGLGTGGMGSKLTAAEEAARLGVPVCIADARETGLLARVCAGEDVGTLVLPHGTPVASRKHWIAYTLRPSGTLIVDAGAARAVERDGRSLLAVGIVGVRGDFAAGDAVRLLDLQGREFARGLARMPTAEVARLAGVRGAPEVVHRDDLVVLPAGQARVQP